LGSFERVERSRPLTGGVVQRDIRNKRFTGLLCTDQKFEGREGGQAASAQVVSAVALVLAH